MANQYFSVFYQPIYNVEKKRFTSAEALIRLRDPKFGYISPGLFIPLAEKSGAIHDIGSFVINEEGKLNLISLNGLPSETNLLITESGNYITFGGTRIKLRSGA